MDKHTPQSANRRVLLSAMTGCTLGGIWLPHLAHAQDSMVDGVSGDAIRLGQTGALTGALSYATVQGNLASKLVFDEVNAAGGIHGRKIQVVSLDDGYDAKRAVENYKKLTSSDGGVLAMFMIGGAPANIALTPMIESDAIPHIAPNTGIDVMRKPEYKMTYHIRASYGQELQAIANYFKTAGYKRIAIAMSDVAFSKAAAAQFAPMAQEAGLSVVGTVVVPDVPGDPAVTTKALRDTSCDVVLGLSVSQGGVMWAKSDLAKLGVPYVTLSLLGNEATLKIVGDAAIGVIVTQVVPTPFSLRYPVSRTFGEFMKRNNQTNPGYAAMEGYLAARMTVEALKRAGRKLNRDALRRALEASPFDFGGYKIDFTKGRRVGSSFIELSRYRKGGQYAV